MTWINIEYRGHFNAQQVYELFTEEKNPDGKRKKWSDVTNNGVRFKHRLKNDLTKQHWQVTVLIFLRELRSGRNILQLLTIHTSIQIRPLVTTRKLIQMYAPLAQSALPSPLGPRFSSLASHCYSLPVITVYASCNLPIWPALPLLWHRSRGEGRSELSKWGEGLEPAKQIRKWALRMFPLGVVRLVWAKACLFCLTAAWILSLVGGDLFSWTLPQAEHVLWGLQDHLLWGIAHPKDGCPTGWQTQGPLNSAQLGWTQRL